MNTDKITLGDQSTFNEELRYDYPLTPDDLVLDIGSYRREFADKIIKLYGCKVECFDALDNRAAWLFDGKLAMGGDYLYTSMYADNPSKEYWCVDILPFLHNVALCKINIEGGEYNLIKYMIDTGGVKNIRNLQVQFHYIHGMDCERLYKELSLLLQQTHKLSWRFPFVWESWAKI